jgi:CRISPR-associated protein Cas1
MTGIADAGTLHQAWRRVRANQGGPGGDGESIAAFGVALDRQLETLAAELISGRYRPGPLRRVAIPKPDGGQRLLAIPCVRDRVAQTAALLVLQPVLETLQSDASFAYRPARGVADALASVRRAHARGLVWTLESDIAQCFDSIPHARLIGELTIWIQSERTLRLIATWLEGFSRDGRGIAQGAPIAPLLANLYLHPLDRLLVAAGHTPVRYADDFVVLTRDRHEVEHASGLAEGVLVERGLAMKPDKTRIVPPGVPFRFLGEVLRAPARAGLRLLR